MGNSHRSLTPKKMIFLGIISLVLLAAGATAAWLLTRGSTSGDTPVNITPPPSLAELAEKYPQYAEILSDPELDSAYKDFLVAYQEGGLDAALKLAEQRGLLTKNKELHVVLELKTDDSSAVAEELTSKGFRVGAANGPLMDVLIPLSVLEEALKSEHPEAIFSDMTSLEQVRRVRIPRPSTIDELPAREEGSSAIGADRWHEQGITGRGVKIGILDLGFQNFTRYLGSALPEKVAGRSFVLDTALEDTFTNHGTVCAEIIHEVAPDAELYLAAYSTEAEMLNAVDWLIDQGVQVISNSTGSAYGPLDGTSLQSQTVERAASQGILWVNSAGNFGESHYRGKFTDTNGDGFHEFAPGDELMGIQPMGGAVMILNWDDWGVGSEDYSLLLMNEDKEVIAASQNPQNGGGADAAEAIGFNFDAGEVYYVAIQAERITRPALFDFYLPNAAIEYPEPGYSVATPGDANSSLTVGAVYWEDLALEPYSSQGPTHDERNKPDISAPAGAPSAVFGKAFSGTSASAPYTAGAGALVIQANPGFTGREARAFLLERALDMGDPGIDPQTGSGTLWLGSPPGAEEGEEPAPPARGERKAPAPTRRAVRGERPGAGTPASTLQTLGLLCAFGAGGVGLVGFAVALILLYANRPSRHPPMARAAAAPPGPAAQGWQTPRQPGVPPPPYISPAQTPPRQPGIPTPAPTCPSCGKPHRPGARFCATCGAALAQPQKTCRFCGRPIRAQSRFCPGCGKPNP